jgi:O-6-methylguanine DNA methyltransferase
MKPLLFLSKIVDNLTMENFKEKVLKVVKKIPKGKTMTYMEVAKKAGSPRAFRAVGNILNKNHNPSIPCHRVICSDGSLGGYNRGKNKKKELLKKENAI